MKIIISENCHEAVKNYSVPDSSKLGFGKYIAPLMAMCDYKDNKWGDVNIVPYGPLSIAPTCKTLHYGQEIFEGMKAYYVNQKGPFLFRPLENAKRFNKSAERMAMPKFDEELLVEVVKQFTHLVKNVIPTKSGSSLYIRPFMFATEEALGIKPSDTFKFMVIASPSASYFSGESIKVLVERKRFRAFPGGTGTAKTGGNYAASLLSALEAKKRGFDQSLWLDARNEKYIEEMSGMNFFCVIDNELVTPKLTDTILNGVTRNSILSLAEDLKIKAKEQAIDVEDLFKKIKSGQCSECFACGTAAVITPILSLSDSDGSEYKLKTSFGPMAQLFRTTLLDIQEGRREGPIGWVTSVQM